MKSKNERARSLLLLGVLHVPALGLERNANQAQVDGDVEHVRVFTDAELDIAGQADELVTFWSLGPVGMKATSSPLGLTTNTPGRLPSRTVK